MRSSMFRLMIILFIAAGAALAFSYDAFGNADMIENDDTDRDVVIDGSDPEIICGDAVNLGSATKASKLQNNNGTICIVADNDEKNITALEVD